MRWVAINISVTVMFAAREVSLSREISELNSGGNAVRSLRQHNTAHRLQIGHANAVPGFHLTSGNRFQRGADGLGAVGTLIDGKAGHSSRERVDQYAKAGQAVKHHEQLYQHRGAADDRHKTGQVAVERGFWRSAQGQ